MPEASRIVTRAQWGFPGWKYGEPPARLSPGVVSAFMGHYEGASPVGNQRGPGMMRALNKFFVSGDRGNGDDYIAVAYNYVIDQDGTIFEGRGLYQGGHCTGWNTRAVGVQFHIGGDEKPTAAALDSGVWLYHYLQGPFPRMTRKMTHSDGIPTECPGKPLTTWIRAGMPDPIKEDEMSLKEDLKDAETRKALAAAVFNTDGVVPSPGYTKENKDYWQAQTILNSGYRRDKRIEDAVAALSGKFDGLMAAVGQISAGGPVDLAAITKASDVGTTAALARAAQAEADALAKGVQ